MIVLTALGNRAWGSGAVPHWVGAILMTVGLWLGSPIAALAMPLLFGAVVFWRAGVPIDATFGGSGAWLDMESALSRSWVHAYLRGLLLLPLITIVWFYMRTPWPLIQGAIVMALTPVVYYCAPLQKRFDPTAVAELVVGALVGSITYNGVF